MTRKHFEALARAVKEAAHRDDLTGPEAAAYIAETLAMEVRAFNPNFNRARFLRACGVSENQ
jgi:hypothetical protein